MRNLNEKNVVIEVEKCSLNDQIKSIKQQNNWEVQIYIHNKLICSPGQIKLFLKKNKRIQWISEGAVLPFRFH